MLHVLESFFFYDSTVSNMEQGVYDLPLVLLSFLVASIASYTALSLAQQLIEAKTTSEKRLLHWGGAFALGAGIWSMHFIGMLSYKMRMAMTYDPWLTLLSMLIAITVAYGVLTTVAQKKLSHKALLLGAILLGFGISSMHYTGMAAMEMDADLRYIPSIFFLSVVIAFAASAAALWIAFHLARHVSLYNYLLQVGAAMVMGAAICGMHYTGMWAAVFLPYADCRYAPDQNFDALALSIAGISGLILAIAIATSVYRRAKAESSIQSSESKLRAMMDTALDAVISMDQAGSITEWNKQAEIIFGWSHDEVLGKPLIEIIKLQDQRYANDGGLQGLLTEGSKHIINRRIEVQALHRNGTLFPVEVTITSNKVQGSYYFTAFLRDITLRKRSERDQALLASIVKSSDDAIISKTLDGTITSWNASAERLFGYKAEEAIGQHISLVIPEERLGEEDEIKANISMGKSLDHYETVRQRKDGQFIDISITVSPILDASGKIIGASKIARDITDRKKSELALQELAHKKDEFLSNMSHELRTPLNVVIGLADILAASSPLTDRQKEFISTLKISADSLLALINDLLDFARLEQNAIEFENIEFDMKELIDKLYSLMNIRAKQKNLELRLHYHSDLKKTYIGDPLRLHQILVNIVNNAVKFTKQGWVAIDIEDKGGAASDRSTLVIKVSDTGIGISADKQTTIFEKFSQADASITRKYGGSGLGLAISLALIEKMGGSIMVESKVGEGSAFTLTIPMKSKRSAAIPHSSAPIHLSAIDTKGRVLLVEDYAPNTLVAKTLLNQIGYDCEVAHNGVEALTKFRQEKYDAVLMDIQMPEMDGIEAAYRIREIEKEQGSVPTPIIAVTARVLKDSREKCMAAGMDDFISKPFNIADLAQKLEELTR